VNPAHLEPVTNAENVLRGVSPTALNARKTHCIRGHALEGDNVMRYGRMTGRHCRACHSERAARYYRRDNPPPSKKGRSMNKPTNDERRAER
jgi:hypothetical protein